MRKNLKLAVVTDIHHGEEKLSKKGQASLPLLAELATTLEDWRPDLVVDLGDRINDIDGDQDDVLMAEVAAAFAGISAPRVHLIGNHDLNHLNVADNARIMGHDMASQSRDIDGWHLVFWQANVELAVPEGFHRMQADLDWLAADLAASNLPSVIFSHLPLDGASLLGNYWFENNPRYGGPEYVAEVREILENAGNVVLCVAGHTHRNHVSTIDGIHYLTVQSLSDSYTTQDRAAGAWASIELGEDVYWRTHGDDRIEFRRPLRGLNEHWLTPLPPFEERRANQLRQAGLDNVKGVILDVDGVLTRGDSVVPGAVEAVKRLRGEGVKLAIITNNARARAPELAARLAQLGYDFTVDEIVTSGQALAAGLEPGAEVHIVASAALKAEVLAAGARESDNPAYVVAGVDLGLGAAELTVAVRHLLNGARLLASNKDTLLPGNDGLEPEAGPFVAFLENASGQKARSFGKPEVAIFKLALARMALSADQVVMVGDNPATDILGATAAMIRSVKVDGDILAREGDGVPTFEFNDLSVFVDKLLLGPA